MITTTTKTKKQKEIQKIKKQKNNNKKLRKTKGNTTRPQQQIDNISRRQRIGGKEATCVASSRASSGVWKTRDCHIKLTTTTGEG
jgi:hypothetical protein